MAEGFAAHHKVPRARFLELIRERTTGAERLHLTETARRAGVEPLGDLADAPLLRLCSYVLGLSLEERRPQRRSG